MSHETILLYLQTAALGLGAIYNGVMAYKARPKIWRIIASGATVVFFFAILAYYRLWG